MVQAEVADRLAAPPGSRRSTACPSVKAAWYADVRRAGAVGRDGLLAGAQRRLRPGRLDPRDRRRTPPPSRAEVFAVVDAAFAQRRKTLRAALAGWAGSPAAAETALRAAGVDPKARGEALGVEEFARLAAHRS